MEELKIQTEVGEMTAIFESYPLFAYQNYYVAWFKEMPEVIVQANNINDAIDELLISLVVLVDYRNKLKK